MTIDDAIRFCKIESERMKNQRGSEFIQELQLAESSKRFGQMTEWLTELKQLREQTRWIPVSERLPEDEQEILFSTKTGRVQIGKYHDDDSANQWYSYRDKCRAWNNVVTAWMPLPEPYAESEEEE